MTFSKWFATFADALLLIFLYAIEKCAKERKRQIRISNPWRVWTMDYTSPNLTDCLVYSTFAVRRCVFAILYIVWHKPSPPPIWNQLKRSNRLFSNGLKRQISVMSVLNMSRCRSLVVCLYFSLNQFFFAQFTFYFYFQRLLSHCSVKAFFLSNERFRIDSQNWSSNQ